MIAISTVISCKRKDDAASIASRVEPGSVKASLRFEELPEDFREFYKRFHQDSAFQMSSIFFPLEGLPENADPEFIGNEKYFWSADQWVMQKGLAYENKDFNTEYLLVSQMLVEENVLDTKNDLRLIRRFARTGSGWRLIYYAGLNRYKAAGQKAM